MSKIIATGSYLPENIVSNEQLVETTKIDSSDEWITKRTGIKQRHFARQDESVADISAQAAKDVLSKVDPQILDQVKFIIIATMSANSPTPSVANQVQSILGITDAWGFDISGACSGFIMALDVAQRMSKNEDDGYTLVIGSEKMSQILDFSDRGTSILFGDGAGAVLIEHDGAGLKSYSSELYVEEDETGSIVVDANENGESTLSMLGRDVFNFVNRTVTHSLGRFIEETSEDFDYLILHQANQRLLDLMSKKLSVHSSKVPTNIAEVANVSAGSIPILMDKMVAENNIHLDGTKGLVLCGFGGGLAWGQIYLVI